MTFETFYQRDEKTWPDQQFWQSWQFSTIFNNVDSFNNFYNFQQFWQFWQFLTIWTIFENFLTILTKFSIYDNFVLVELYFAARWNESSQFSHFEMHFRFKRSFSIQCYILLRSVFKLFKLGRLDIFLIYFFYFFIFWQFLFNLYPLASPIPPVSHCILHPSSYILQSASCISGGPSQQQPNQQYPRQTITDQGRL